MASSGTPAFLTSCLNTAQDHLGRSIHIAISIVKSDGKILVCVPCMHCIDLNKDFLSCGISYLTFIVGRIEIFENGFPGFLLEFFRLLLQESLQLTSHPQYPDCTYVESNHRANSGKQLSIVATGLCIQTTRPGNIPFAHRSDIWAQWILKISERICQSLVYRSYLFNYNGTLV